MQPTVPEGQNQNPTQATEAQAPVNPTIETAPQDYQTEAGAGTSVNNMPGAEAITQPQAPVQGNPEGYGQISTPTQNSGQENMQSAQTSPNPDAQFSTPDITYTPQQPAPQAQPSEAEVLRTMEAGNASLSDNSGNEMQTTTLNQKLESTPNPNPEPVVVGADTSSSEFPGGPQTNVSPETTDERQNVVNPDIKHKELDPVIREGIKRVSDVADYAALIEEGKKNMPDANIEWLEKKRDGIVDAYVQELAPIFRSVHGIRPQDQTQEGPSEEKPAA